MAANVMWNVRHSAVCIPTELQYIHDHEKKSGSLANSASDIYNFSSSHLNNKILAGAAVSKIVQISEYPRCDRLILWVTYTNNNSGSI